MSVCAMMATIRGSTVSSVMACPSAFQAERRSADNRYQHLKFLIVYRICHCCQMWVPSKKPKHPFSELDASIRAKMALCLSVLGHLVH